ncbi:MAG: 23S rRNA (uracil(1939)-C(5))-methyltransferase RlmD [Patescibacteria group bacterium]|nr:23S rRNA (uracil(1939)-C(5))-methyltransferase RlmD [Patescibacteria group bacterium]
MKIQIEKLVFGGQGIGRFEGKTAFVWNALPGEEVEALLIKKHKNIIEAIATEIIKPSPDRIKKIEEHFLACSPWQILSYAKENIWKKEIAKETYKKFADLKMSELEIESDEKEFGYRNKIEYSFTLDNAGKITLAFFIRGKHKLSAINDCQLATEPINKIAHKIVDWLNLNEVPIRSCKSLIVRSNQAGETIAALFIKDVLSFEEYPELDEKFLGFTLYFSDPHCPASIPTQTLYSVGQDFLIEEINGIKLRYGVSSFFQVNVPIFEKALADIEKFLDKKKEVLDFYSGVGAISLALHNKFKSAVLVDNNEEAISFAKVNIELNKIKNCEAQASEAEKIAELITKDKILIVDPPRVGLHYKVIDKILEVKPRRIIYLSCNLATQARDLKMLKGEYEVKFSKLYNFFPRTPHIEGLCVLERK